MNINNLNSIKYNLLNINLMEDSKDNQELKINRTEENEDIRFNKFINSVFKDKSKKKGIIEKLRPFMSLKVIPQREIDRVYSSLEKIDPEKIDLIKVNEYKEEKYCDKNIFVTKSKSVGLSDYDLNFSASILGHKQSLSFQNKTENSNNSSKNSSMIHCIHSIIIKLFRIVIDFKDIKLAKQVSEELQAVHNSCETEKKLLLEKLVEKYGLYIPLELTVGGRINYSFDAKNEEEMREINSLLQRDINMKLGGGNKLISASLEGSFKDKNSNDNSMKSIGNVQNLYIKIEGGDYSLKDDFRKWIHSFNFDNLEIIEYKSLQPIYCFIPGLESKLSICLQNYEDIVLKEIYTLIEKDFSIKEKELFEGTSDLNNYWKVGITEDRYKGFIIYKRKMIKKLNYIRYENSDNEENEEKTNNKINDIICGEIPDGFIICGWILKTNANSNYYDIVANWKRKKTVGIIGNECFKFEVDFTLEEDAYENIDIDWYLEIFCIHSNFLVHRNSVLKSNHYFQNCDCGQKGIENCSYNSYNKGSFIINNYKKPKKKQGSSKSKYEKYFDLLYNNNKRFNNKILDPDYWEN